MTLNQIVYNLSEVLPEGARSQVLLERLKFTVIHLRATLLRRDYTANGSFPIQAVQNLGAVPTKLVDKAESCKIKAGCLIRVTTLPLPRPVRMKSSFDFTYIGHVDQHVPYTQVLMEEVKPRLHNKYTGKTTCASYQNDKVYVYNSTPEVVNIRGVFEDPREAAIFNSCVGCDGYDDNTTDFPLPADMLVEINQLIMTTILRPMLPTGSDQVEVKV